MPKSEFLPATHENVSVMGRVERTRDHGLRIGYPGVSVRLAFEGTSLRARVHSNNPFGRFLTRLDGASMQALSIPPGTSDALLAERLAPGKHTIEIVRLTETWQNVVTILGFALDGGARLLPPEPLPARRTLFIGDSVTCGEGIDRRDDCRGTQAVTANAFLSYGMLVAEQLEAQCQLVCYGGRGLVRDWQGRSDVPNAPRFFELAVPEALDPPSYDHREYPADAIIVSLGTNDFTLSLPDFPAREHFVRTYVDFVRRLRSLHPSAHVFLTEGAMVHDGDPNRPQKTLLRAYIGETVQRLADTRVHAVESRHYPGGPCDPHPTREQHALMAHDLAPIVRRFLGW